MTLPSRIPNKLVHEALKEGRLPGFRSYSTVIPEKMFGNSRFDFLLASGDRKCLLEVKSCTLAVSKLGFFPDSPTLRERRHLSDLIHARRNGYRACIMFVIQRSDVKGFMPNCETDSEFAEALKRAKSNGVEVLARKCIVRNFRIDLDQPVLVFM